MGLSGDDMNQTIPSMKTSDDIVDINQKELVLIQNLEGETKERTAEEQSIEPLYTDEKLIDPMIEVTLPSSTAVTDSHEIAKSIPLKCVFDIPATKDSKALLSREVCTPLQNTKTSRERGKQWGSSRKNRGAPYQWLWSHRWTFYPKM